jgi:hypothetical protein
MSFRFNSVEANVEGRYFCISVPILELGARRELAISTTPRPLYVRERDPVLTVQDAGLDSGLVGVRASLNDSRKSCPLRSSNTGALFSTSVINIYHH